MDSKCRKFNISMIKLRSLLPETRIITPTESILDGYITVYHGTTLEIAKKAKQGELGPVNIIDNAVNILVTYFHETEENARILANKYLSLRRKDPPRLFVTTQRQQAINYAVESTKFGGESTLDLLIKYLYDKYKKEYSRNYLIKYLTDSPAVVTITLPLKLLLTHPHWNSPAIAKIKATIRQYNKYKHLNFMDIDSDWGEYFIDQKIPKQYIQRIDKV